MVDATLTARAELDVAPWIDVIDVVVKHLSAMSADLKALGSRPPTVGVPCTCESADDATARYLSCPAHPHGQSQPGR